MAEAADDVVVLVTDVADDPVVCAEVALVTDDTAVAPPGAVVGTVDGCDAVFQVAVVGYAVVATVGDDVP